MSWVVVVALVIASSVGLIVIAIATIHFLIGFMDASGLGDRMWAFFDSLERLGRRLGQRGKREK